MKIDLPTSESVPFAPPMTRPETRVDHSRGLQPRIPGGNVESVAPDFTAMFQERLLASGARVIPDESLDRQRDPGGFGESTSGPDEGPMESLRSFAALQPPLFVAVLSEVNPQTSVLEGTVASQIMGPVLEAAGRSGKAAAMESRPEAPGQDASIIRIHLQPESLGSVEVRMSLKGDGVSFQVQAQTKAAAEHLLREKEFLVGELEKRGLKVDSLVVGYGRGDGLSVSLSPHGVDQRVDEGRFADREESGFVNERRGREKPGDESRRRRGAHRGGFDSD